jgi:hypothetical protein
MNFSITKQKMPETSLQFIARRGVTPDVVAPARSRGVMFGPGTNDLSRSTKFTQNKGRDTSLAVQLNPLRTLALDQLNQRSVGVQDQEARLTASEWVKVTLGGTEDADVKPKLTKTIEGIKLAIEEMKTEQILSKEQAEILSSVASADLSQALATVMNIISSGTNDPIEIGDIF